MATPESNPLDASRPVGTVAAIGSSDGLGSLSEDLLGMPMSVRDLTEKTGQSSYAVRKWLTSLGNKVCIGYTSPRIYWIPAEERKRLAKQCDHSWRKASLVTQEGGYDLMRCDKCGAEGKRYGLGAGGVVALPNNKSNQPGQR